MGVVSFSLGADLGAEDVTHPPGWNQFEDKMAVLSKSALCGMFSLSSISFYFLYFY